MLRYFSRFSPIGAINDLRRFLAQRQKHELVFLFLSLVITTALIAGFLHDSRVARPYKREIVYFKSWKADRSHADIMADRQRDFVMRTRADVTLEKRQADSRAQWRRYDDALDRWGL